MMMKRLLAALILIVAVAAPSYGQQQAGKVVATCGTQAYGLGFPQPMTVDQTGLLCSSATLTGTVTISGAVIQGAKGSDAAADSWYVQPGTGATFPVTGTFWQATQPVSGTVAATQGTSPWIVAGGGTAGTAASGVATIQGIASMTPVQVSQVTASNLNAAVVGTGTAGTAAGGVLTVQGVASMTKLLVTPDSVALPANQSVNVSQINAVTPLMGNGVTGTGSQRVTVASDNTPFPIKIDQTTPGTTNAVSLAQVGATTVVNGGLAGTLGIGGATATNVAITDNPINLGAQAVSSENTAVTTARKVQLVATLTGKQITQPYANPENSVNGTTAAITDTTSTSTIASAGGSLRNYLTQCTVTNSHATVGTFVKILDGSTIIWEAYAAAAGGGAAATFPVPLRGTAATAVNCQPVTTGANVICSCSGYTGT